MKYVSQQHELILPSGRTLRYTGDSGWYGHYLNIFQCLYNRIFLRRKYRFMVLGDRFITHDGKAWCCDSPKTIKRIYFNDDDTFPV